MTKWSQQYWIYTYIYVKKIYPYWAYKNMNVGAYMAWQHSQWIHTATHAHFCGLYCSPGVTGTTLRLNPPLRCPLFGRWKSTEDSNKCDEASHFLWSHFLGDSIKAMASMGKWINATYTRLLRCWYICNDSKYLKAEHLILRFFNLYRLWCTGWFRVWLRMLELKQLST